MLANKNRLHSGLPLKFKISFDKIYNIYSKYASVKYTDHVNHSLATKMVAAVKKYPKLIDGIEDLNWLDKHKDVVNLMVDPLFPEALSLNEIKAASVPFSFNQFRYSERFGNIIKDAGVDFELSISEREEELIYVHACIMILGVVYGKFVDLKRPFYFNIPNKKGNELNYRVAFNADMASIEKTDSAPEITDEDFKLLINSFDNLDVWREKFPQGSYLFKGFGIMNLFDVTADESISEIRTNLLKGDEDKMIEELQQSIRKFYDIDDLSLGFTIFDISEGNTDNAKIKKTASIIFEDKEEVENSYFYCKGLLGNVFDEIKSVAISDVNKYAELSNNVPFSKRLLEKGIQSIILIPIQASGNSDLAVLEIASPRAFELNSINLQKLSDIIPMFQYAVERASKEMENTIEASIQEHYTAIHPTVKWKFTDAASKFINQTEEKSERVKLEEIVFENVQPLFGQADIKGSSVARNETIKEDLLTQLNLAKNVLLEALKIEKLPIYEELIFRVNEFFTSVKNGLKAGDEVGVLEFLKKDIYPTFTHIEAINNQLSDQIKTYMDRLDPELQVVYEKRKSYETSVTFLNDQLAKFIDNGQEEAQNMFPHYFERYKTDGIEHNIYIGQSLVKNKIYDKLYLDNIRLWQLQMMYDMENVARLALTNMDYKLEIASMILVHSNPLAIRFRMDEKQFDVDGAYNIRYAIIKKRIDKAHIKCTDQRITVPGKLSIVYSQEREAVEYRKYLKFLQSKHIFGKIEELELEDLQGVSGLKALRVKIIYQDDHEKQSAKAMDELIKEIQS
tara:strand:- start:2193 stop:4574 length:2382 start_codon:yes stop_codon:yes gene_type:complete